MSAIDSSTELCPSYDRSRESRGDLSRIRLSRQLTITLCERRDGEQVTSLQIGITEVVFHVLITPHACDTTSFIGRNLFMRKVLA